MEAAVAEKEAGMTEWNDGRLDDLSKRVDDLATRVDVGFAQIHEDMREMHVRFDGLQRTLIQVNAVIIAALIGLIATQV